MSVSELEIYKCPNCRTLYAYENEAVDCCFEGALPGFMCDACEELYETKREAETCCGEDEE